MNISLPKQLEDYVASQVKAGAFPSAEAFIRRTVENYRQQESAESAERQQRFAEACNLQEIESNPLTSDEKAMFAMFERKGWSDEQCRKHIKQIALDEAAKHRL